MIRDGKLLDRIIKLIALITYQMMIALGHLVLWTPFVLKSAFLSGATFLWWNVVGFRRHIVLLNLSVVFPRRREETMESYRQRLEAIGRQSIWHACYGFVEIIERFGWSAAVVRRRVRFHGLERFQNFQTESARGYFVLTAHLGSWELAGLSLMAQDVKLAALTRYLRSRFWNHILDRSRRRFGLKVLGESYSGRAVVRSVREGYAIAFMMDQHTGRPHGILTKFLGQSAWSPKGLAILSRALKSPIIEAYLLRDGSGGYDFHFGEVVPTCAESGVQKDEDVALHVALCNEKMEAWIRRYPEQYLWLHRRFKSAIDYKSALPWETGG